MRFKTSRWRDDSALSVGENEAGASVTRPAVVDHAYAPTVTEAYALAPVARPRAVTRPVVVDDSPRVTDSYLVNVAPL
jgi:hypothetical protein